MGSAARAERHRAARGPGTPLEGGVEAEGCGRVGEPGGRSSGAARGRAFRGAVRSEIRAAVRRVAPRERAGSCRRRAERL